MAAITSTTKKDPYLKRFAVAQSRRKQWDAVLADAYHYTLPQYEDPNQVSGQNKGKKRGADVYDSTGADALDERANRTRGLMFPKGRQWLFVRPEAAEANANVARLAEHVFDIAQAAFEVSNLQTEVHQSIRDGYISTGGMALDVGTDTKPLAFEALPVSQIIPEEAADGVIRTNFREYELAAHEIPTRLPDVSIGKFTENIQKKITNESEDKIGFVEAQVYEAKSDSTVYKLFLKDGENLLDERSYDVGRLIVFRSDKVPNETGGRGPVLRAMPEIKTANKVVELILKNASIAVVGMWQADDDGVLNPENIELVPATIIPKAVGSQGLTPLQPPGDFNVSQIVLKDLQEKIRRIIYGPALPPVDQGVRTAYENAERKADQLSVEIPSLDRLEGELFRPMVRRALYVLTDPTLAASTYYIQPAEGMTRTDFIDMLMEVLETPSERSKRRIESQEQVAALSTAASIDPEAPRVLHMDDYWLNWFKNTGVDNSLIKSPEEIETEQAEEEKEQAMAGVMEMISQSQGGGNAQPVA